jgi:hypothetical protein
MKLHFIKPLSLAVLVISLTLASCLKDKDYDNGGIQSLQGSSIKVISIGTYVSSQANFAAYAYNSSAKDTVVNLIPVELGGPSAAPTDIHVTLVQNDQLITDYDNNNGTDYVPPTGLFTVVNSGGVVTIPKGSRVGYLQIKFTPNALIGTDYALGYSVSAVQEPGYTISGNLKDGIAAILIKNKYDGLYQLNELTVGWGAYSIADGTEYTWPSAVGFATVGSNSNLISTQEVGVAQVAFSSGGGLAGFGAATPQYNFDPTTDKLTSVTNLTPDSRNRAFPLNPAITTSRFDNATHNIYLDYEMTQNGRPTQFIYDTLIYIGPR